AHAVIPWGFSLDIFPHSDETRDPQLLLAVGTSDPRKGLDRALRLLAALPESYRLVHIGGPLTPAQLQLASQLALGSRVEHLGFCSQNELAQWYRRAGCLVFPSRYEGFGLPVVEARLSGLKVFASTNVPALDFLGGDGGTQAIDF